MAGFGGLDLVAQVERVFAGHLLAGGEVLGVIEAADALGAVPVGVLGRHVGQGRLGWGYLVSHGWAPVGAHQGMSGNFVIADLPEGPPVVYQDTAARGQIVEGGDDIAAVALMWDTLKSEALPRAASKDLVEEAAKTWT